MAPLAPYCCRPWLVDYQFFKLQATKDMITTTAFAEMDKDEDGKITLEEFTSACMAQEEFSKMLTLKVINIFIEEEN